MPRRPDPGLEERILQAAQRLWKKGGEEALTLRAVAKAAGTNTPAVYRRFQDRREMLRVLVQRLQQDLSMLLGPCKTPEEACEAYLDYALSRPREYELIYAHLYQLPHPRSGRRSDMREYRPVFAVMGAKLAERLGGSPEDHTRLSMALWALTHGAAMIFISKAVPEEHTAELHSVFRTAVATLMRNEPSVAKHDS